MRITLSVLISLVASHFAYSQSSVDTIYYNKQWKKTIKDSCVYYRVVHQQDGLYQVRDYFHSGMLQMSGAYSSLGEQIEEGKFTWYYESGKISVERFYIKGKMNGKYTSYHESGRVYCTGNYKKGNENGDFLYYYDEDGNKLIRKEVYASGKFKKGYCYTREGKDTIYFRTEMLAEFPGGTEALMKFLSDRLQYPQDAKEKGIEGKVIIKFAITETGEVDHLEVIKSLYPSLDAMALEVVKSMPRWKPGMQNDKPVSIWYTLPVTFKL